MAKKANWVGRLFAAVTTTTPTQKSFTNRDPDAANIMSMARSDAGALVNATTAMQLDAVWACVRIIAESIAMMPLSLFVKDDRNPRVASRHRLHELLHTSPNSKSTAAVFWEAVVSAMLLQGNAYVHKKYYDGQLAALIFMAPNRLHVVRDMYGNKQFYFTGDDGVQRQIPAEEVWQIQGYSLDGRDGVSVIEYATQVFGTAIAAEKNAARTFVNGMLQAVYYSVAAFLTDEQRDTFRKHVKGTVERGEAPILEGGVDVKALGINPKDAQLLESRSFSIEAICRWFRVPPSMVGHSEKSTSWGSGIEQQVLGFITFTLTPWITRIEQGISLGLLTDVERTKYEARFDVSYLLRGDSAARSAFYSQMVNNGCWTRDEVRQREGLPLKGGNADILTVQSAMTPLDSLGVQQVAPAPAQGTTLDAAAAALQAFLSSNKLGGNIT